MKLLYDMHSHILPGVDDGAKSVEESLSLINRLTKYGVTDICLTPHFYTHKESLSDFLKRRNEAFDLLKSKVGDKVNLHLGAEVFVTKYLFSNEENLKSVCYDSTDYMLTEFSYSSTFSGETMNYISKLMNNHGIKPILAHVERYPYLMKHLVVLEELIYMGVMIQSNACSFTEFPLKIRLTKMLKNGYIQLIGSDAHSLTRNSPDAFSALSALEGKKIPKDVFDDINKNSKEIFM